MLSGWPSLDGNHLSTEPHTQDYSAWARPLWVGWMSTQQKLREQTRTSCDILVHIRGLAVFVSVWLRLGCKNQRQRKGSGSTLEACVRWCATKMHIYITLLTAVYCTRHWVSTSTASAKAKTRGQSNLTKSASRGAHSPVRGHPRGPKFVPLNSWGRGSYYCSIVTIGLGCTVWPQCTRVTTNQRPTTSQHSLSQ